MRTKEEIKKRIIEIEKEISRIYAELNSDNIIYFSTEENIILKDISNLKSMIRAYKWVLNESDK